MWLHFRIDEQYLEQMMDVDYMARVINKTDEIIAEKKEQKKNWERVQRVVFLMLSTLALVGVLVALSRTYLAPSEVTMTDEYLQPVDVVFLLDSSRMMKENAGDQQYTVEQFTRKFTEEIEEKRRTKTAEVMKGDGGDGGCVDWLMKPLNWLMPSGSHISFWPEALEHGGVRFSLTRFASILPNGSGGP